MMPLKSICIATTIFVLVFPRIGSCAPPPPVLNAKAWVLMDQHSGMVLASAHAKEEILPGDLSKLMIAYIVLERIKLGQLTMDTSITIPKGIDAISGPRMFLWAGDKLPLSELLQGMIATNANDAAYALAHHIGGDIPRFIHLMNAQATRLGLADTRFDNIIGILSDTQISSALDIAMLARALLRDFPRHAGLFAIKQINFDNLVIHNSNNLLWQHKGVDGLIATRAARQSSLVASLSLKDRRLIAVIYEAPGVRLRFDAARRLLDYGTRHFETRKLYRAAQPLLRVKVGNGSPATVAVGVRQPVYAALARTDFKMLETRFKIDHSLHAPIAMGTIIGMLELVYAQQIVARYPLETLEPSSRSSIFMRLFNH